MKEKNAKGFVFSYWKLSHRQKFIRTLWLFPLILLFSLFPKNANLFRFSKTQIIVGLLLLMLIQAIYNYYKWKSSDASSSSEKRDF